jgi:citrate lyase subunit beta-like protein
MTRSRRALLYMPGSNWRKIEKAAGLDVDVICMDLEDGVAPEKKEAARAMIVKALKELDFGEKERLVRINQIGSGFEDGDLNQIIAAAPDGLVLPKVSSRADVEQVNAAINQSGKKKIPVLAQIESAAGLVNIKEIVAAGGNLDALIFGAEDYSADVGAKRSPEAEEVLFARSAVVAHAAANGLQAIDMLWTDFKDPEGLQHLAKKGASLGFDGMQIIHPDQIETVQKAYSPSLEEISRAERIIEAFEEAQAEGKGVFALDGRMVDMPIVKAAQRVLARRQ